MNRLLLEIPECIETPRLRLEMPRRGLSEKVYAAIMDGYKDYVRFLTWPAQPPTLLQVTEDCIKHHAEFILRDLIRYIIIDKTTNVVVGRCAFPPFQAHWTIPQFGISYFIRKSERSKGYATEAAHAMALLAFKVLKAKKVEIWCEAENVASQRIPQKLGFTLEYTQKGSWPRPDGQLATLHTYALFSETELPSLFENLYPFVSACS